MSQWMAKLRAFLRKCFLENMQLSPSLTRKPGTLQLAVSSHDIQLQFQNCNIKRLPLQKQSCDQYQHSYVVLGAWVVAKDASKRRRINPRFVKIPLVPFVDKEPSRREIGRGEGLEGRDGQQLALKTWCILTLYRVTHHVRQNLLLTLICKLRFSIKVLTLKRNFHINVNDRFWRTWWVTL